MIGAVWLSSTTTTTATAQGVGGFAVPFLPVNGELTATRNQARQKLGRLNAREFTALLIDLLSEAKRRQTGCLSVRGLRPFFFFLLLLLLLLRPFFFFLLLRPFFFFFLLLLLLLLVVVVGVAF